MRAINDVLVLWLVSLRIGAGGLVLIFVSLTYPMPSSDWPTCPARDMALSLDVAVCEPMALDLDVFSLWLSGYDAETAGERRVAHEPAVSREFHAFPSLLLSDTLAQYRNFQALESHLHSPQVFLINHLFQLPPATKCALIECYYAFDEVVVREILGRKLGSKNRKDLDDISERTGISLRSCRRQFDNIKQVLRVVDDYEGSLVQNISQQFNLPEELARRYSSVVFLSHNRFECNKRRVLHLTFSDFTYCANLMIDHWTAGSEGSHAVDDDLELDRDFLQELHDLKLSLIDSVWIARQTKCVAKELRRQKFPTSLQRPVEAGFKALSKAVTVLGASLIHSKDLRDFFVDLVEKVIEPCRLLNLEREDVDVLLNSVVATFPECEAAHTKQTGRPKPREKPWRLVYLRYLDTLRKCVLAMYHD